MKLPNTNSGPTDKPRLFLSYRRDDNPYAAGRIYDHLVAEFGEDSVYFDVTASYGGVDYRKVIDYEIAKCDAVIVVIGQKWLTIKDSKNRPRIGLPDDVVHIEVRRALDRGIPVTPVTVDEGEIPSPSDLPEVLKDLSFRNGYPASAARFRNEVQTIIQAIRDGIRINNEMLSGEEPPQHLVDDVKPRLPFVTKEKPDPTIAESDGAPSQSTDIFVSYAQQDDEPQQGDRGWISEFLPSLQWHLTHFVGRTATVWSDRWSLDDSKLFTGILEAISSTSTFVVILTPRYLRSPYCMTELDTILKSERVADGTSNIFVVYRYPVDINELPEAIKKHTGWRFYELDGNVSLEFEGGSMKFLRQIQDMAFHMSKLLPKH